MRINIVLILSVILIFASINSAFAHKPIQSDGTNTDYDSALIIPDHKISWAIYEELQPSQTRFYKFDAKKNESFYSSIVIPKMDRFENFKPSLTLISKGIEVKGTHEINSAIPDGGVITYTYRGEIPSKEFYEPFTQTTYWERQEIRINIPADGEYYIAVSNIQGFAGKYSLAVGTIEDFTMSDFFSTLPLAWIQTKIFFEDYFSVGIIFSLITVIPGIFIARKIKKKKS